MSVNRKANTKQKFFLLSMIIGLSACANMKVANNDTLNQAALQQAHQSQKSPDEAILEAKGKVAKAEVDALDFYAPLHMKKAKNKLKEAEKLNSKIKVPEDKVAVISAAIAVDLFIANAYKNKSLVEEKLVKSLKHKMVLEELGTNVVIPKAYGKGVRKLKVLIKDIEGGLVEKAIKGEEGVLKYFVKIETETLKVQHLSKAEAMIKKAKGIDADKLAEQTYKKAMRTLNEANSFVRENYRDREGIKRVGDDAFIAASYAYHVTVEVKKIIEVKEKKAEQYILYVASLLQRINGDDKVKNLGSLSFYDQSLALAEAFEKADVDVAGVVAPADTDVVDVAENTEVETVVDQNIVAGEIVEQMIETGDMNQVNDAKIEDNKSEEVQISEVEHAVDTEEVEDVVVELELELVEPKTITQVEDEMKMEAVLESVGTELKQPFASAVESEASEANTIVSE
ncbi:MAG: hypothetical protein KUG82_17410 [Pseudomonadales bacterium]|nr:hypothetical protein [Pseudomonadales bacterium]